MLGCEKPVKLPDPSLSMDMRPRARIYGLWIFAFIPLPYCPFLFYPCLFVMLKMPIILTRVPGVRVSAR